MRFTEIKSCYIGPEISPEQFIPEHFFIYIAKGTLTGYDGNKKYAMKSGDYCIVRKNHLARYNKQKDNGQFEKVVIVFDEPFLQGFKKTHNFSDTVSDLQDTFILLNKNELIPNYISSLMPYYNEAGKIDDTFSRVKREELLLILLKTTSDLVSVFFDFGIPEKMDLEAYMNQNYKFNVSMERFAYLTGRSLSAFKRDFRKIFHDTPSHWLVQKRLQEAYFLIDKKDQKPNDIYLDLGFEDLSHFSFAFKKKYGINPTKLAELKKNTLQS